MQPFEKKVEPPKIIVEPIRKKVEFLGKRWNPREKGGTLGKKVELLGKRWNPWQKGGTL